MPSKFESEIRDPEKVEAVVNPLDEAVNEKRYTQPNVNASTADLNKPIDEPRFAPPPLQPKNIQSNEEPKKREPINPEMKSIPKKETEFAAKQAAQMIIQGYEWAHGLANNALKISEKKLNQLQAEGEINLNAMIDYEYGRRMRAGEFFQIYNEQVGNVLTVSEEFKEETLPVLERVLAKRGIGLTDEQYLMYLFGKDIAAKSIIFFQQKATLNMMIESIKAATTSQYAQQAPPPPPPRQRPERSERPQRPEPAEKVETVDVEEENNFAAEEPEEKQVSAVRKVGRPRKKI
jgi:hypothetical protein